MRDKNVKNKASNCGLALLGLSLSMNVLSGHIEQWNGANILVDTGPFIAEETYASSIYTDSNLTTSYGAVIWVESDVVSPGMSVVFDDDVNGSNCLMTAGVNPFDLTTKQCSDPFQSSKRFKLATTQTGTAVDLVYDVTDSAGNAAAHRVFQKYLNVTGKQISDITIQLGFGTGNNFTAVRPAQGLGFSDSEGNLWVGAVSNGETTSINLDALFPFGLFGDADTDPNHDVDGYFDSTNRARFDLLATETSIKTTGISDNYKSVFGDFLSKSQSIRGFFWDSDDDDSTDPLLIAHETNEGWFTLRPDQWWLDYNLPIPEVNPGDNTLTDNTLNGWASNPDDYNIDFIEDLANLNFNYHITVGDFTSWPSYDSNDDSAQFTLRVSSISVIFKDGFD
ncbi:choice-of-anchor F family protein [Marinicella sp. S1101]|uniref:choice-of-anchor F family protein n=1 Tax=Marinicella marina TaxID=2996016 RepID=UPI002260CFAA|nr:choice-of-anchor F family protein [Marinicella marina]MCX7554181.1 choice-of-anchor F family protein [Marinicella marina]MDJ1141126.1 choice-of-anchor F family protein [Marinicella marina]